MTERLLAVVTGASSGIGETFARKLAARGYDLLLVARREDRLQALAQELMAEHRVCASAYPADLACDEDRERLAERIRATPSFGLLVNNAGFGTIGFFHEARGSAQDQMHRLHVLTPLRLSHAALTNLISRGNGSGQNGLERTGIINVSSMLAFGQAPSNVSYSATKTWMNSFTLGLAVELASRGSKIKVQALCPGFTISEFHSKLGMIGRPIPRFLWMTSEFVVDQSLRGFDRGKLIVIPGWHYKLIWLGMKILPGKLTRAIAGSYRRRKPV